MKVLGIDPATKTGWAIVERPDGAAESLLETGTFGGRDNEVVEEFATTVFEEHPDLDFVAIERPYMMRNANTVILLSMIVGACSYAFKRVPVAIIPPAEWRSKVISHLLPKRPKRDDFKAAAKQWAHDKFEATLTDDEAEASAIAYYHLRTRLFVC